MKYKWILASGSCEHDSIMPLVTAYMEGAYQYLTGCTDCYKSGRTDLSDFLEKKGKDILEMRVFSPDREILFTRSRVGQPFAWRATDDSALEKTDYLDTEQYLDINTELSQAESDGIQLFTTVGGAYKLPIGVGSNAVRIRTYIAYDDNGMGSVMDHRVCGFTKK